MLPVALLAAVLLLRPSCCQRHQQRHRRHWLLLPLLPLLPVVALRVALGRSAGPRWTASTAAAPAAALCCRLLLLLLLLLLLAGGRACCRCTRAGAWARRTRKG
jgi:hypothetical protein